MMVQVLVHEDRPLRRRHRPKERVWMGRTAGWSGCGESLDECAQACTLALEVALVDDHELLRRRRVATERRIVARDPSHDHRPNESPDERARRTKVTDRHLHCGGAMGRHLCGVHRAPLALAVWAQPRQAFLHVRGDTRLIETLHDLTAAP